MNEWIVANLIGLGATLVTVVAAFVRTQAATRANTDALGNLGKRLEDMLGRLAELEKTVAVAVAQQKNFERLDTAVASVERHLKDLEIRLAAFTGTPPPRRRDGQ